MVSNADNDLFVDNVLVRQTPAGLPDHVTLNSPEDMATGLDPENVILNWSASLTGGAADYYEVFVGVDPIDPGSGYYGDYSYETSDTYLDLSAQSDIDLAYSSQWYWAVLPYNGTPPDSPNPDNPAFMVWDFTLAPDPTIVSLPHNENFDGVTAPTLPWGWSAVVNASTTAAYVNTYSSTTYAVSTPNSARLYNSTDTAANLLLITPDFTAPLNTIKVRFYARSSAAGETLLLGTYNPTTEVFTQVGTVTPLTTTQTQYDVPFSTYIGSDTFIAFKHGVGTSSRTIYIDNVEFIELVNNDLAAVSITGDNYGLADTQFDFTITVKNEGLLTQNSYTVNLMSVDTRTLLASLPVSTPIAPNATAEHQISWTPTVSGIYEVYGNVALTGDQTPSNDNTSTKTVYVAPADVDILAVGNPETTTTANTLPTNVYFKNGVTEMLYFPDELHLTSGDITALVFKNNFTQALAGLQFKIWMGTTTATDLTGGWLPAGGLTQVFDGTLDFPLGVNEVVVPLQTPFAYTGNNLVVRFNRVMDTVYYLSTNVWYYTNTSTTHPSRSRYLQSDSTLYDPLAPSAAGTILSQIPNTWFVVDNAVLETGAEMQGYVYQQDGTTPIVGATVTLTERYATTTDANGYYHFIFWENHNVAATASMATYYSQTVNATLTMGNIVNQNFSLTPMPRVTVSGVVTANDAPGGLVGADISIYGGENYTAVSGTGGAFSIPNVLGSSGTLAYTIQVSKEGYQTYSSAFNVVEANVDLGTINLIEYLWTPYNLVATHSGDNAQLVWDPAGEPDYFMFDFEADNGDWVGSGYGDWEWANNYNVANFVIGETGTNLAAPTAAHSGSGMWATKMLTNYSNSGASSYLSKTVDLAGFTNPQIRFWSYENVNGTYDYCQLKVNNTLVWGPSWQIPSTAWVERVVDLSAYANQTVELKFEFYASTVVSLAGWYIDDIYIGPAPRSVAQLGSRNSDRSFESYDVYRFLAADEGNELNWTTLQTAYANTTYTDTGFGSVDGDIYKWAVKANYTAGLESDAIISNSLGRVYDPADIAATTVGATVVLSWTAEPGAAYYKVYECDNPYGTFSYLGYSLTPTYTINTPVAKKFYHVIAVADEAVPSPAPPAKK